MHNVVHVCDRLTQKNYRELREEKIDPEIAPDLKQRHVRLERTSGTEKLIGQSAVYYNAGPACRIQYG